MQYLETKNHKRNSVKYQGGQAMLTAAVFLMLITVSIVSGLVSPTLRSITSSINFNKSRQTLYLAESGIEDSYYRLLRTKNKQSITTIVLPNGATATVTGNFSNPDMSVVNSSAVYSNNTRTMYSKIVKHNNYATFNSGMQLGKGGLLYAGSNANTVGSITSIGPIQGTNLNIAKSSGPTGSNHLISSGYNGLIDNIQTVKAHSSDLMDAYANSITNSVLNGDGYYYINHQNTTFNADAIPNNVDQRAYPLPLTDTMIEDIKKATINNPYFSPAPCPTLNVSSGTMKLGYIVINCTTTTFSGSATLELEGPVWFKGDLSFIGSAKIKISDAVPAGVSVPIIVENPLNLSSGSVFTMNTTGSVTGTGTDGVGNLSRVLVISRNNNMGNGGSAYAIHLTKTGSAAPLLVYTRHGGVNIKTFNDPPARRAVAAYKGVLDDANANISLALNQFNTIFQNNIPLQIWFPVQWKEIQ